MSGAVSRELERLATKALGISPGPPTKAERHRPDTIRRDRPKQEVLFDTLEEDWMPETEPWETRFPSPVAAARRTDGLTTRFRAAPRKNYLKGPLSACKAAPRRSPARKSRPGGIDKS